jgi:hypothetical protein
VGVDGRPTVPPNKGPNPANFVAREPGRKVGDHTAGLPSCHRTPGVGRSLLTERLNSSRIPGPACDPTTKTCGGEPLPACTSSPQSATYRGIHLTK